MARKKVTQETPKKGWQERFLAELTKTGNVRLSCKKALVSRGYVYRHKQESKDFGKAWRVAIREATDALLAEARKRALKGSDTLIIFLLKAYRRDLFGDKVELRHRGMRLNVNVDVARELGANPEMSDLACRLLEHMGSRLRDARRTGEPGQQLELDAGPALEAPEPKAARPGKRKDPPT